MTDMIEHYFTLNNSPIVLAPILDAFYQELKPSKNNLLLSYLVLPMVIYPVSKKFLLNARRTSSLKTYCDGDNSERLIGLQWRVNEFRDITNIAIMNSISCNRLILQEDMSIIFNHDKPLLDIKDNLIMDDRIKAAKKIATIIFNPYPVSNIYLKLGIKL